MTLKPYCLGLLASLALLPTAPAALFEGFDSITLSLPKIGDAATVDGAFFSPTEAVPQGTHQLLLTTLATGSDGGNNSGTDATSVSSLENFLNLQSGTIPTGGSLGDGSAVKLTLNLSAGAVVSFQYRFLTSAEAGDGNDFAFYTLQLGGGNPTLTPFANIGNATTSSNSAFFNYETGVATVTLPAVGLAGTYTLGFGVVDGGDDVIQSGVLIDNVQVQAVPEPSSALLLAAGVLGGMGFRRRRSGSARV